VEAFILAKNKKLPFAADRQAWEPPEELTVSECADKYRVLSGKSAKSGPWETSHNPVIRAFMDCFGYDFVKEIWLVKPTQSGGTEGDLNMILYAVLQDPGPMLFVEPNENLATEISTERIDDMIKHSDALKERTILQENARKIFSGMTLYMGWAGSPVSLASRAIRYLIFDEPDKYRLFSGREASPLKLGQERTNTFREIMKRIYTSTPVLETDVMTQGEKVCDARFRYHVFCPHCGFKQEFKFSSSPDFKDIRIKYDPMADMKTIEATAFYECVSCKQAIHEDQRMEMVRRGVYVDMVSGLDFDDCMAKIKPRSVGFQFWRVHSPDFTFGDIAVEYLKSKDKPSDMMNFTNSWLAEPWAEKGETKTEFELLKRLADVPARIRPNDTICLTCGIDPGQKGYWFTVWAWTKLSRILIDYGFESFVGSRIEEQREKIKKLVLESRYLSLDGQFQYPIWRAGMDTGGGRDESDQTMTARAYMILRGIAQPKRLLGVKGRDNSTRDALISMSIIDKMPGKQGKAIPGGLQLWLINADMVKNNFSYALSVPTDSQGAALFNRDVREDVIKHILAQERRKNRLGRWEWVNVATDDHLLDCSVYAMAVGDRECWGGIERLHRPQRLPMPNQSKFINRSDKKEQEKPEKEEAPQPKIITQAAQPHRKKGRRILSRGIE
jgi:phage terminase large subunit GpA-like protein